NAQAQHLQEVLFQKYRVHTVWRKGVAKGPVIRVTPGLYSTFADSDALANALHAEHAMFV
ncbi:MAG: aminotransferase class V-fold PLP-dependent enzyme, partial [Terriglobus sp.]